MQDFLPLGGEGLLAIGGLVVRVRGENLRSIERYDSRGVLQQAWQLTGYPGVSAVFDERAPGRMLIWDEDTIDGIPTGPKSKAWVSTTLEVRLPLLDEGHGPLPLPAIPCSQAHLPGRGATRGRTTGGVLRGIAGAIATGRPSDAR